MPARKVSEPVTPGRMGTASLGVEEGKRVDRLLQEMRGTANAHADDLDGLADDIAAKGFRKFSLQSDGTGTDTAAYVSAELPLASTRSTHVIAQASGTTAAVFSRIEMTWFHFRTTGAPALLGAGVAIHADIENYAPGDEPSISMDVSGNTLRVLVNDGGVSGGPTNWAVWVEEFEHTP